MSGSQLVRITLATACGGEQKYALSGVLVPSTESDVEALWKSKITAQERCCFGQRGIAMRGTSSVLHTAPQPPDDHVVASATTFIHAEAMAGLFLHASKRLARELGGFHRVAREFRFA